MNNNSEENKENKVADKRTKSLIDSSTIDESISIVNE